MSIVSHLENYLKEMSFPLYTPEEHDAIIEKIKTSIKAPWVHVSISTLGGRDRSTIFVKWSLQPKADWHNGILQNSPYGIFSLDVDGTLDTSVYPHNMKKFRKTRVKDMDDAIAKMNAYIESGK